MNANRIKTNIIEILYMILKRKKDQKKEYKSKGQNVGRRECEKWKGRFKNLTLWVWMASVGDRGGLPRIASLTTPSAGRSSVGRPRQAITLPLLAMLAMTLTSCRTGRTATARIDMVEHAQSVQVDSISILQHHICTNTGTLVVERLQPAGDSLKPADVIRYTWHTETATKDSTTQLETASQYTEKDSHTESHSHTATEAQPTGLDAHLPDLLALAAVLALLAYIRRK